jgi:hypothetical protein
MADRYWVGGTGIWNTTSTTNWSATSGGAGGASVPTAADSVFFDQAGTYSVTCTGARACLDFTVSAGIVSFLTGTTPTLTIAGSLTLLSTTIVTGLVNNITFNSVLTTNIVTLNGRDIAGATFTGGGTWTLGSAYSTPANTLTFLNGIINTAGYALSLSTFNASGGALARTLNLSSSVVTIISSFSLPATNFTFNAGTSTINISNSSGTIGGGFTFYNVSLTATSINTFFNITSTNTFNNLTVVAPSTTGIKTVTFNASQTINGVLSITNPVANRRVVFSSANTGIAQTLTVNGTPNIVDVDFKDLYVVGSAAPISGTRIGDRTGCRGIIFSAPKTVYWNFNATGNWNSSIAWANTPTGIPNIIYYPLPQDTAAFTDAGSVGGTVSIDTTNPSVGTVDMSARTLAMTLSIGAAITVFGDWKNGTGTAFGTLNIITFSGRTTQAIFTNGKAFTMPIVIDALGGIVQLSDAFIVSNASGITVTTGTFKTNGYSVTSTTLISNSSNIRTVDLINSSIYLSSSTPLTFTNTNITLNVSSSAMYLSYKDGFTFNGGGLTYNDVYFPNVWNSSTSALNIINGANTFNTFSFPTTNIGIIIVFGADQIITGSLILNGSRTYVVSDIVGITRTLTVNNFATPASDLSFRDISIVGAAAPISGTRFGDGKGNSGIIFDNPKTVYWASAAGGFWSNNPNWSLTLGGSTSSNYYPLPQDTAILANGYPTNGTIIFSNDIIGTIDMSANNSGLTLNFNNSTISMYGDWITGPNTLFTGVGAISFIGRRTQNLTSAGKTIPASIGVNNSYLQLTDALTTTSTRTFTLTSGTFDAVTYNVTTGSCTLTAGTCKMGSGTWTLTGTGTVWTYTSGTLIADTSNIVLSDTSTTARTFSSGVGQYYNKITIGGATGISTTTFSGIAPTIGELASTKTVAHTIALGTSAPVIGKWSVTGTVGNLVTVTGTNAITIVGARVSGVNYLAMGTTPISTTSPGEFYAGPNSTGTGTGVILANAPTGTTRYWVGGNGTWDATTTTNWSTTTGGAGGASVPTSADDVIFDNLSGATSYTVISTATVLRCKSLTFLPPASGTVTWAGTAPLVLHGSLFLPPSGFTRTWSGGFTLSGSATGNTFTTSGQYTNAGFTVNGIGSEWILGNALSLGAGPTGAITLTNGTLDTAGYSINCFTFTSNNSNVRALKLNNSAFAVTGTGGGLTITNASNFNWNAGTSTLTLSNSTQGISASPALNFYNVIFGSSGTTLSILGNHKFNSLTIQNQVTNYTLTINNSPTFNTLVINPRTASGISNITLLNDITIGTLTAAASSDATKRIMIASSVIGTPRTIAVDTFTSGAGNLDFRDINIIGTASPISGTRFGDCKGNSGITFDAPKTVYWSSSSSGFWGSGIAVWSDTPTGTPSFNFMPLAQDTAVFPATTPANGSAVTMGSAYNIGTIDMSARTVLGTNTLTLALAGILPTIYGDLIHGAASVITATNTRITFAGRTTQKIISAGKNIPFGLFINSPGGSVNLQDAFSCAATSYGVDISAGTFNTNGYGVTGPFFGTTGTLPKTINFGTNTLWVATGTGIFDITTVGGVTILGTGTLSFTNSLTRTFNAGSLDYSGIALNINTGPFTLGGNNIFKDITGIGSSTLSLAATVQKVTQFTLSTNSTISGTSAAAPASLIFIGATNPNVNLLTINNVRAFPLFNTWYAGPNSINNGSLGWYFEAASYVPPVVGSGLGNFLMFF